MKSEQAACKRGRCLKGSPVGEVLLCASTCPIYSQVITAMLDKAIAAVTVLVSNKASQC